MVQMVFVFTLPSLNLEMSNKSSGTLVSPSPRNRNVNLDELGCAEQQRSESNYFPAEKLKYLIV